MTTMHQARFHGAQDFRIDAVDTVPLGTRDVRIEVAYNGICGSDLHLYFEPGLVVGSEARHLGPGGKVTTRIAPSG
jgi:threonine dehydrogenase-like Zn-dependent dehydrogenase